MNFLANVFGSIMNLLCQVLSAVGIVNVSAGIVFFAIVMGIIMIPITVSQKKFEMAKVIMAPKMQKIKDHYEQLEMTDERVKEQTKEINAIYKEAGVTPSGRVIGFVVQIILLIAMYQVAGNVPAYVPMFQETGEEAFLLFGVNVGILPSAAFASGFSISCALLLLYLCVTMLPWSLLVKKKFRESAAGCMLAVLWTVVALKLPIGLVLYWGTRNVVSIIINVIAGKALKNKVKEG